MRFLHEKLATALFATLLLLTLQAVSQATPITDSCAFQGRLTDASDNPVADGPRDLTLSLWTDSVGGTMRFSEVRAVTLSKGLYSTCIGCGNASFADSIQGGDLWLQTQLPGQAPMSPRIRIRDVPRAMYASGVFGETISGSSRARGIVAGKPNVGTGAGFALLLEADLDGDGKPESFVTDSVTPGSASRRGIADSDEDGNPEGEISDRITPTTTSVAIKTKGTGADANRTSAISGGTSVDSANVECATDYDGDGVPDATVSQSSGSTGSQLSLKTGNNGMPVRISTNLSVGRQTQSATFGEACDMDGDGVPESQFEQICAPDSIVQVSTIGGGGGGGGGHASNRMRTRINDLESKLQNIGLLRTTSNSQSCTDTSANTLSTVDLDNDGVADRYAWQKVDNTGAVVQAAADLNHDGIPDIDASVTASSTRSELKGHFQTGDIPTESQFSTVLDATGAHAEWANTDGGPNNVGTSVDAEVTRSILKQYFQRGDKPTQSQFSTLLDATGARSDWSSTTSGATTSLSIVVVEGVDPITHSSGAKLTAGGVWTNASDVNLKENFRAVDGEIMLEKIDELPIRQWNYKNESDSITHIGPTAQDFKELFGVGENDRTISTIDPSGIALAGIKQLHKENFELKAKVARLEGLVQKLVANIEAVRGTK